MRLTGSRAYYRPSPPKMPPGLVELMEGLTKEVLKHNPADVNGFCAGHMQHLLEIRDGPSRMKLITLEEKIAQAQQKVRQRGQIRRQQYNNLLLLRERESNNYADENVMSEHIAETSPILTKQDLTHITETEMSYPDIINGEATSLNSNIINNYTVNSDVIKTAILGESTKLENKFILDSNVIELVNKNDANVNVTFHDFHENANEKNECYNDENTDDQKTNVHKYDAIGNGLIQLPEINIDKQNDEFSKDNIVKSINKEQVLQPTIDKECSEIQKMYTDKSENASANHPNILNDNDTECINVAKDVESSQINSETNQVEQSVKHMLEIIDTPGLNLLPCPSNGVKNIDTIESNLIQSMTITTQDDTDTKEQITIVPIKEENAVNHENKALSITNHTLVNDDLVAKSNGDNNQLSMIKEERKDSNFSHTGDFLIIKDIDKDFSTFEIKDAIIETQIQSHGIEDEINRNEVIKETNILNIPVSGSEENIVHGDLKQKTINEILMKSPNVVSQDTTDANIKNDTQTISLVRTMHVDTDIKNNAYNENSNMDLETAAVTIQKVFRAFLFKSRASTFDDAVNDEENLLDGENGKKEDGEFLIQNPQIVERRPHCITRMDTVLQTVNEEKSLSLSTDDSSTLSSAATIIQAHVRGFLVRNKLNSNKTVSTNSFPASNSNDPSLTSLENDSDQHKNKTILNIHIVPEEGNLSRDESFVTSMELSLDGSPPSSVNLHPLGYDKSERRKQLKREDAIQSVSPPSNNSGKLSEDVDSIKENLGSNQQRAEGLNNKTRNDIDEDTLVGNNVTRDEIDNIKESAVTLDTNIESAMQRRESLMKMNSDEMDVVMPFTSSETTENSDSKLIHSGEFHDLVLPTRVARSDTTVVREFKSVLVYFLLWNPS